MSVPIEADWIWNGQRIRWSRCGDPAAPAAALLIHGFGASLRHWRHNQPVLAEQVEVYALDLLGFGASDKPRSRLADEPAEPGAVAYGFDLWASQVVDFLESRGLLPEPEAAGTTPAGAHGRPLHLIGNSIGGVVALNAARLLQERGAAPAQVVLIDCAQRTLDDKRVAALPSWERAGRPLLKQAVRQRWLLAPLFRLLAREPMVRAVLRQAYPSGANVDAELLELLLTPAREAGALESFRGFVNLFNDRLAPELLAQLTLPVRMLWGARDPWEDPAEARLWADTYGCVRELQVLEGLGHCPHDEAPERVNPILQRWLQLAAGS
ncbi:MAG: alpha/beta fold hydrolase [Synechococcaceae cyanobacterium]|nr:alpha/beta fold hydrolase [Synechococcaceae cyanobacterium]